MYGITSQVFSMGVTNDQEGHKERLGGFINAIFFIPLLCFGCLYSENSLSFAPIICKILRVCYNNYNKKRHLMYLGNKAKKR